MLLMAGAAAPHPAFRADYKRGAAFTVVGFAAGIAEVIASSVNPRANHGAALGVFAGKLPVDIAGCVEAVKARTHLEAAMGFSNRPSRQRPRPFRRLPEVLGALADRGGGRRRGGASLPHR
ncbi:MAG TPA: hypothetical protein VEU55_09460 [Gemmatimonadales bacterium]|nr:hypothetical protein [Gemmatimonadales bacterium]